MVRPWCHLIEIWENLCFFNTLRCYLSIYQQITSKLPFSFITITIKSVTISYCIEFVILFLEFGFNSTGPNLIFIGLLPSFTEFFSGYHGTRNGRRLIENCASFFFYKFSEGNSFLFFSQIFKSISETDGVVTWPTTAASRPGGVAVVRFRLVASYRVLLGFTGFYWVLLGFTGLYWVLLGFTGFYWVCRYQNAVRSPNSKKWRKHQAKIVNMKYSTVVFIGMAP